MNRGKAFLEYEAETKWLALAEIVTDRLSKLAKSSLEPRFVSSLLFFLGRKKTVETKPSCNDRAFLYRRI